MVQIVGNFHPLIVHLPIGFLLLAWLFQWLSLKEKYASFIVAAQTAYLVGAISAVLSAVTGWALASSGEYEDALLLWHRWMGILLAVLAIVGYILSYKPDAGIKKWVSIFSFMVLLVTGHLGGTLTHGEGFLTKGFNGITKDSVLVERKVIPNVQEAIVFEDIIQPILLDKCAGCHSARKQKGGLRLDGKEWIIKGGKEGETFVSGNAEKSELYERLVLSPLEEKHMPPKGKKQLSEQEINLIHWWISTNAGFDKKVRAMAQPLNILPALQALQTASVAKEKPSIPDQPVDKANEADLNNLRKAGIIVLPVATNSNYLSANFVSIQKVNESAITYLKQIDKQLVWLKLGSANLTADSWKIIGQCKNLTRLSLEHTNLTDETLKELSDLSNLQYLNLVGTKISGKGMLLLKGLNKLENVFLSQTKIQSQEFAQLIAAFPKTRFDSGNYQLTILATDTLLVKAPIVKK